ncbi:MAG: thioredoxin [Flavobacteriales bacterium]|nr:thioredoxin [Flavobacteriales bacterium]MCX7768935.1 thioredoxin [Flavobacteriales bacterium]MDW8409976.1 thioredoxin [Flavobacteriales bacterium]
MNPSNNQNNQPTFSELIRSDKPVLVDFFAEWCGPCKMLKPILEQVKSRLGDSLTIIKVDVDQNPLVASAYHIRGVPTLILFHKGEIVWRQSGVLPAAELESILREKLAVLATPSALKNFQ